MATSVDNSPADQSDAPHTEASRSKRRRWPGILVGLFVILSIAVAVTPLVVDVTPPPQNGPMLWPYLTQDTEFEGLPGPSADAPVPSAEGIAAILEPHFSGMSGDVAVSVRDGLTGEELYNRSAQEPLIPASSTKAVTAAAALAVWGSGYRIPTRVVAGTEDGQVVLIAGGDVTLTREGTGYYEDAGTLADLAEQVVEELGTAPTTLIVDTSIFPDDPVASGVDRVDIADGYTAELTPFMVDGGRTEPTATNYGQRSQDPTKAAADHLADLLGGATVEYGTADPQAAELGVVYSPTMQRMVEAAMVTSDNLLADALARQAALGWGVEASFAGGAAATLEIMESLGISTEGVALYDGSGLSTDNVLTASLLSQVVTVAVSDEGRVSGLAASFAVAGYSGSLERRFGDEDPAHGEVRAKTGTLTQVSSLTGMVLDADGRWLTFSFIINGKNNLYEAERVLDKAAAALVDCGCS